MFFKPTETVGFSIEIILRCLDKLLNSVVNQKDLTFFTPTLHIHSNEFIYELIFLNFFT